MGPGSGQGLSDPLPHCMVPGSRAAGGLWQGSTLSLTGEEEPSFDLLWLQEGIPSWVGVPVPFQLVAGGHSRSEPHTPLPGN